MDQRLYRSLVLLVGVLGAAVAAFTRPVAGQHQGKPPARQLRHQGAVYSLALAPDGKLLATGSHDHSIHLWNVDSGKQVRALLGQRGEVCGVAFAPGGRLLASGGHDNVIRLWDVATGKQLRRCVGHTQMAPALAFAPDGKTLASGGHLGDHTIRLWDAGSGKELHCLRGHAREISALAFSPDGRLLASAGADRTVRLWDAATGKELRRCPTPEEARLFLVTCLAFAPDGRTLAASSWLNTIFLWEVATGRQRRQLAGHQGPVECVAFSADGGTLVSAGTDNTLRFWAPHSAREVRRLQVQATLEILSLRPGNRVLGVFHSRDSAYVWSRRVPLPGKAAKPLSGSALDSLWKDLARDDAGVAYRAVGTLAADSKRSVAFLKRHLRPVAPGDPRRIRRLIADLDNRRFEVRRRARAELEKLGDSAESILRSALKQPLPLEARKRVEQLLAGLRNWSPERLRLLRALEAVELMASPEARGLLQEMARGVPDTWLTRSAQAALKRLSQNRP
jgi:hypothetical protein